MGQATKFIDYLFNKSLCITDQVVNKAKDCLMDYLAVTYAGADFNKNRWQNYLNRISSGKAEIYGYNLSTNAVTAALINGFNAHSLELDDGQRFAMIHLGGSVISGILAAAAENNIAKKDVITGIIMGYECACRLALSVQPSHKKTGYHTAGTCGTVGTALGIAFALKFNKNQMETVLASAVTSASGLLEIQEQSSELKPYNVAQAAANGVCAAYMGFTDYNTPDDILNGDRGFLKLFCQEADVNKLTENNDYFEIERIYVKPYAACRHCHSAIEAVLNLRKQIDINKIESISIETYLLAVKGHDHKSVNSVSSAKLSMPYSVAAAIVLGNVGIDAFSENLLKNKDILALMQKTEVIVNDEFSQLSSQKRIAKVNIKLSDGSIISNRVDYAKGEPENPMTRADIILKAKQLNITDFEQLQNYVYGNLN